MTVIIFLAGLGYIVSVGIAALLQWLINLTFHTNFNYSIWLLGLLLWVLYLIFGGRK